MSALLPSLAFEMHSRPAQDGPGESSTQCRRRLHLPAARPPRRVLTRETRLKEHHVPLSLLLLSALVLAEDERKLFRVVCYTLDDSSVIAPGTCREDFPALLRVLVCCFAVL